MDLVYVCQGHLPYSVLDWIFASPGFFGRLGKEHDKLDVGHYQYLIAGGIDANSFEGASSLRDGSLNLSVLGNHCSVSKFSFLE